MAEKKEGEKLVRYIAERLTAYMDTPREQRKAMRLRRSLQRASWSYRWFGMLPLAASLWLRRLRSWSRRIQSKTITFARSHRLNK